MTYNSMPIKIDGFDAPIWVAHWNEDRQLIFLSDPAMGDNVGADHLSAGQREFISQYIEEQSGEFVS